MVPEAETAESVGKRKKRSVYVGYGGNTCKLGEYDGRNGRNVLVTSGVPVLPILLPVNEFEHGDGRNAR